MPSQARPGQAGERFASSTKTGRWFLPFLAIARGQELSRTARHGVAFWWCLRPLAFFYPHFPSSTRLSLLHPRCAPLALSVSVSVGRAMAAPLLSLTKVISVLPSPIVTNWHKCPAAGTESPINASYLQGFAQKCQWYCLKFQALMGNIIKMFLQVRIKLELHYNYTFSSIWKGLPGVTSFL